MLLYGQQLARIAALRRDQVTSLLTGRPDCPSAHLHRGPTAARRLSGGSSMSTVTTRPSRRRPPPPVALPGLHPGRPFTAAQLGARLRRLGIEPQAARRGALSISQQPCRPVLARALNLTPNTAVRWVGTTGGDWNRYAAELLRRADRGT